MLNILREQNNKQRARTISHNNDELDNFITLE